MLLSVSLAQTGVEWMMRYTRHLQFFEYAHRWQYFLPASTFALQASQLLE
jgi:hypothetical protein